MKSILTNVRCYGEPEDDDVSTANSDDDDRPSIEEVLIGLSILNSD